MKRRFIRCLLLLAGIVLGQTILYEPSLVGRKILLPLDVLQEPGSYLPKSPDIEQGFCRHWHLSDLLYYCEPARRFMASELNSGRFPMWAPYHYAGAPFVWPKFSPILALGNCISSPRVLAWVQLVAAIIAGSGAYVFFRRVLQLSFWSAVVPAWCYPLTAFFVLWTGFPTGLAVYWLPWVLVAVDRTARETGLVNLAGLAVATCLALVSGHIDMAGQVLLGSGLFGLWCLWDAYRGQWFGRRARWAALRLTAGWTLGFMLAAPYVFPVLDYARTGSRMMHRAGGMEERPPVGLTALPQIVLPDMYGASMRFDWDSLGEPDVRVVRMNQLETTAAAYTGILATLVVAPIGLLSRRHRALNWFWASLLLFALGWSLNLPGLVQLLRLPGLNMMSHNRLVFLASFALLAMSAVGFEVLTRESIQWSKWFWGPLTLLASLCAFCLYRATFLPEPIESKLAQAVLRGRTFGWVRGLEDVQQLQGEFSRYFVAAAIWSGIGTAVWLLLRLNPRSRLWLAGSLGILLPADLLCFAYGRNAQSDPALYFPPIPALQELAKRPGNRVIGSNCLPPGLAQICGLREVRGYDSVDPSRFLELLTPALDPRSLGHTYAVTLFAAPKEALTPAGDVRVWSILDMLGVKYVILHNAPPPNARPVFQSPDYWVLLNPAALPRFFVPRQVQLITDDKVRLRELSSPRFDPREVAFVEEPVNLPRPCRGEATLLEDSPTHLTVATRMDTPGLGVLTDLWDKGWQAYLNGKPVPILRANHALRGVVLPAGSAKLEFRYKPASFVWGLRLFALAGLTLLAIATLALRGSRRIPACDSHQA